MTNHTYDFKMNYDISRIRIKCAEIVGWTGVHTMVIRNVTEQGDDREVGITSDQGWIPNYPESADAALELVAWMAKPENGGWKCYADKYEPLWSFGFDNCNGQVAGGVSDTFQLAVCLAFLRANGIDPETL